MVNNLKIKFSDGNALEEHLVEMQKQHWTLSTDNFWLLHSFAAYLKGSKDCSDEELKEKIFEILIRSKLSSHKDIVVKRSFTEGENFLDDPPEGSN